MVYRFIKKIIQGKTLFRFLTEESLLKEFNFLNGSVLDLASGSASYINLIPKDVNLVKTDLNPKNENTLLVDCNKQLSFENDSFEGVLFINALYTLEDRESFIKEVYRILKPGGRFICVSPFIANEMPEPHDYCRLTYQGLEKLFNICDWKNVKIIRIGERFSSSVNLLHPAIPFSFIRVFFYSLALIFDKLIPKKVKYRHPVPLGYTITAIK